MVDTPAQHETPVAIVTGAGSGIGRAICTLLAGEGYRVALVGRRIPALEETVRVTGLDEATSAVIVADIAAEADPARVVDAVLLRFGRIDAIVNNAGEVLVTPLEATTEDVLDRMFGVNVFGPARLVVQAWPAFVQQGGGCVVNVSSMSAIDPFPGLAVYGAAKSALEGLTRGIVNEGRSHNIRAFSVAPGAVETAMLRSFVPESVLPRDATLSPKEVARVIVDCILGRRDGDIGRVVRMPA